MNTLSKLQMHLVTPIIKIRQGYSYKDTAEHIMCADGVTISVQASETHYCTPRSNTGPYTEVELWRIGGMYGPITQFEYDSSEPSGYVPIEAVVAFIDEHGGIKD